VQAGGKEVDRIAIVSAVDLAKSDVLIHTFTREVRWAAAWRIVDVTRIEMAVIEAVRARWGGDGARCREGWIIAVPGAARRTISGLGQGGCACHDETALGEISLEGK
jgi:hypothetical protein